MDNTKVTFLVWVQSRSEQNKYFGAETDIFTARCCAFCLVFPQTVYWRTVDLLRWVYKTGVRCCAPSFTSYSQDGEAVTWLSCRRLVGRGPEPLIHPSSLIFGQGWKPQTLCAFHTGGLPKHKSIIFQREPSPVIYLLPFQCQYSPQTRESFPSSRFLTVLLHHHMSIHQKFHPVLSKVNPLRTYLTLGSQGSSHAH